MDHILLFFSHLILFTAGLAVAIFWIVALTFISIEIYDLVKENYFTPKKEEEDL